MELSGYIPVNSNATVGGAPIDAAQMDAFRQNDALFEQLFQAILCSPLIPNGVDPNTPLTAHQFLNADEITVNTAINLTHPVPLIWFAKRKISISNTLNARGQGAPIATNGDFGGSGGGGGTATGGACVIPGNGFQMLAGGAINTVGNPMTADWASRALAVLSMCRGGAGGGDATGGAGGGVVILCAPEIEIVGTGQIDVRGADAASGNAGGGGGGLVILSARKINGVVAVAGPGQNVFTEGGAGAGTGGAGGKGIILSREFA